MYTYKSIPLFRLLPELLADPSAAAQRQILFSQLTGHEAASEIAVAKDGCLAILSDGTHRLGIGCSARMIWPEMTDCVDYMMYKADPENVLLSAQPDPDCRYVWFFMAPETEKESVWNDIVPIRRINIARGKNDGLLVKLPIMKEYRDFMDTLCLAPVEESWPAVIRRTIAELPRTSLLKGYMAAHVETVISCLVHDALCMQASYYGGREGLFRGLAYGAFRMQERRYRSSEDVICEAAADIGDQTRLDYDRLYRQYVRDDGRHTFLFEAERKGAAA